jgi:hypothetical protein
MKETSSTKSFPVSPVYEQAEHLLDLWSGPILRQGFQTLKSLWVGRACPLVLVASHLIQKSS